MKDAFKLLRTRAIEFSLHFLSEEQRKQAVDLIEDGSHPLNTTLLKILNAHLSAEQAFKATLQGESCDKVQQHIEEAIQKLKEVQESMPQ
jgi:hypothetical protein